MNTDFNSLWVEKYRPKDISSFIVTESNKKIIETYKTTKEIPNLLFTGTPGLGKTSLAKIIVNSILDCQYLYINASDENGIDTIRSKVTSFAQTRSIDGKIKVIILDETDGLSIDAQRALRNTMEEFAHITRFILTANYSYKVILPLQSRCQALDLTPPFDGVLKRCAFILKNEKISVNEGEKAKLLSFIKRLYPDLRKIINELQKFSSSGSLLLPESNKNDVCELIFNEIAKKNITSIRRALIENENSFNSDYLTLLRDLFNYIDTLNIDNIQKKKCLLVVAEHIYRSSFVADQEINCYSCLISLSDVF